MSEWSGWVRFQWTDDVVAGYTARVANWREQLADAVELVQSETSRFTTDPSHATFAEFKLKVQSSLTAIAVPRQYRAECRSADAVTDYAVAYCFNIFQRGASYRAKTPGMAVAFHSLRDAAAVTQKEGYGEQLDGPEEIPWGRILDAYLSLGELERDLALFLDVLRALRTAVHAFQEYRDIMKARKGSDDVQVRQELLQGCGAGCSAGGEITSCHAPGSQANDTARPGTANYLRIHQESRWHSV
jgi:hypothetical protein